ncbi:hypothetical protein DWB85_08110 [Seongchinamella sediminis]|uniref:Uncharacterized protein n=1 Tax=Seongchinamella sediminis TaxID=2283635 RepID=A0A3L7E1N4_9GAMM|nr:hypothetical protein DWB85_08110 [Seongchinamella sediminis]
MKISSITTDGSDASATYTATRAESSGGGKSPPSVLANGDVTVFEDTNVTFELETAGFTFPANGAAVIRLKDNAGTWHDVSPGDTFETFTIAADQPGNNDTELELEDDASDGTSAGVTHPYNLFVVSGGTTFTLDPNFINRN